MKSLYNIAIWFYALAVRVVAMFNPKVRLMWQGEREAFAKIESGLREGDRVVWVHAASLGEFEQGRPLIEKLKRENPEYKILLTFFSPSGYEVRKNYASADVIAYLPLDTPRNARRFVELVKPEKVVFVKYEFWLNYLAELRFRGIETYIISAIFRPNQVFFKWYGGIFREGLKAFKMLFVQNEESKELLKGIGVENVMVAGDTRFDRVADIAAAAKKLEIVESFVNSQLPVLVVGSSWGPDEDLLTRYINERAGRMKMIIAPHEVREERIKELTSKLTCKYALYTQITDNRLQITDKSQLSLQTPNPSFLTDYDVLVVNTIGVLSSVYQYGQVAYIGGGFGVGIHNTLEAAAWGMPVVFGPNYHKFQEAKELIECGAGQSIKNYEECARALDEFFEKNDVVSKAAAEYVASHTGATEIIHNSQFIIHNYSPIGS
jgi:3-deoxy-D-manno-octulosonic-acid transferase